MTDGHWEKKGQESRIDDVWVGYGGNTCHKSWSFPVLQMLSGLNPASEETEADGLAIAILDPSQSGRTFFFVWHL